MSEIYREWGRLYTVSRGEWVMRAVLGCACGLFLGFMAARIWYNV